VLDSLGVRGGKGFGEEGGTMGKSAADDESRGRHASESKKKKPRRRVKKDRKRRGDKLARPSSGGQRG